MYCISSDPVISRFGKVTYIPLRGTFLQIIINDDMTRVAAAIHDRAINEIDIVAIAVIGPAVFCLFSKALGNVHSPAASTICPSKILHNCFFLFIRFHSFFLHHPFILCIIDITPHTQTKVPEIHTKNDIFLCTFSIEHGAIAQKKKNCNFCSPSDVHQLSTSIRP